MPTLHRLIDISSARANADGSNQRRRYELFAALLGLRKLVLMIELVLVSEEIFVKFAAMGHGLRQTAANFFLVLAMHVTAPAAMLIVMMAVIGIRAVVSGWLFILTIAARIVILLRWRIAAFRLRLARLRGGFLRQEETG